MPTQSQGNEVVTTDAAAHARVEPANALPWRVEKDDFHYAPELTAADDSLVFVLEDGDSMDYDYIVHAANAYPKLVAALREASEQLRRAAQWAPAKMTAGVTTLMCDDHEALLRELGEL